MSTFYTTFLSKSDFSFVLLLVTFESLEVEQSYIPHLKALRCGINVVGAQGCSCMSTFCHAPLKIALLLHKMAKVPYSFSETVAVAHLIFEFLGIPWSSLNFLRVPWSFLKLIGVSGFLLNFFEELLVALELECNESCFRYNEESWQKSGYSLF